MAYVNPGIAMGVQTYTPPRLMDTAGKAVDIQNALVAQDAAKQEIEQSKYAQAIRESKDALRFVTTPEQYMAWHESNHQNPVLGSLLSKMGITADQSRAKIMAQLQQPGGLESLIQQSAASADQMANIMEGRINALAAREKAAAGQARTAEQQAAVDAVIRGGQAAPAAAPIAQAFPVAPPVDTGVYEPGTPGAINQLYAQSRTAPTPALNALTEAPSASADPRVAQLAELDSLAMGGNKRAAEAAKIIRSQLEFEQKMSPTVDASKRFVNLGEQGVFDVVTQQMVEGTARKPKTGTPLPVINEAGDVVYVPPEEAIGKTPGSQAPSAAERAKQQKAEKGRNAVDDVLKQIGDYYAELDKLRGVPSTERNVLSNIGAYAGAAMPFAGRAMGTREQQLRDQITQIRSALVREIKNATGMSAQELNSNVELQLALEAATDPTISIQANLETLRNLSALYGSGKLVPKTNKSSGGATAKEDPLGIR